MNQRFDSYAITYIGGPKKPKLRGAYVYCFNGSNTVGLLQFFVESADVEQNSYDGQKIIISYDITRFKDVLQILQQEKPLYLYYDNSGYAYVGTWDKEPTGEQEGV